MAIVTLSRELGSLGTEIADMLAAGLGFARLDKESLEALLAGLGMSGPQFERRDEKRPGFWEQFSLEKVRYLDFMRAAVYRFAGEKDCVIVGRGAHVILRGVPGTLRLRIMAPLKVRVARLRERFSIDEQHALRMIHQSDHDRAGYHKYFFNTAWDSLADYDLVVNTAGISPAEVVETVSALLRSSAFTGAGEHARCVLRDLRTAQDVIIAIAYREQVPVMQLDAVCNRGVVALEGTVRSQALADRCGAIAAAVGGVERVVNNVAVVEYPYYPVV
jgi:cytidylate kinase